MDRTTDLSSRFDQLAELREYWQQRADYYYHLQHCYFRFLVPEGVRVLEVGSGLGDLLAALKPSYGVGIDVSQAMVERAKERHPELHFHCMDAMAIELKEHFDVIVITDVIGHFDDIQWLFEQLRDCCDERTRIVIGYYNFVWEPILGIAERLGFKMAQKNQNWLSLGDLQNLLHLAGFETVKTERRVLLPKRVPLLSDFLNSFIAPLPGIRLFCLNHYLVARPIRTAPQEYSVTIVIPCRNERGHIDDAIARLPLFGLDQEIIFVDGHSTDGTPDAIRAVIAANPDKDISLMIQDGTGKGDAVRKGFAAAKGDMLMILDADLTMPPEDLPKFYRALADGKGEFINGCRLIYPMEREAMRFLNMLGNKFFALAFSWLLNQPIKDTLCGTKVLLRSDYQRVVEGRSYFGEFDPFGDFDLLFGASKLNLKMVEMPIRYRERQYGETNISRFRHGWLLLKMTVYAFGKLKVIR